MSATEAKDQLESFKLARFKIMKSGYATEQDPMPVTDPITGKTYDMKLGKEYLMPKYMTSPLNDCYRPMYETHRDANGNATMDHKSKTILSLNYRYDELTEGKEKYLAAHPETEHLFSVDDKLRQKLEAAAKTKAPAAKKEEVAEDFK